VRKVFFSLSVLCVSSIAQSQSPPVDFWAVKPWDYWASTPQHIKMCNPNNHCYSSKIFPDKRIIQFQDNDMHGVISILPNGGVGVVRDFVWGMLRCFSDVPGDCSSVSYPPGYSPGYDIIPVLNAPGINSPTPYAKVYYSLQTEQVNIIDLSSCIPIGVGGIVHSGSHFMLSSFDFGPPVGTLSNIYVTEEGQGCPLTSANPMHCMRLERYFFSREYGRIRQEGWDDPTCNGSAPETCLGNYSTSAPGANNWIPGEGLTGPVPVEFCL
jgi:hypothetical protein